MLIHKDLPYSEQKTDVRLLDWFAPEGDCRATMVWMHGGGIEGGDRRGFDGIASQLCAAGIGGSLALAGAPVLALALAAGAAATFWDGLLEVKMTARLNRDFPSDRRATLVSVQSMAYSLAMLPVSPLAGALCDRLGYSGGMAALGLGLLSLVAAGMAAHRCRKRRRQQ